MQEIPTLSHCNCYTLSVWELLMFRCSFFLKPSLLLPFVVMTFYNFWINTRSQAVLSTMLCPRLQLCSLTSSCELVVQNKTKVFVHWCKVSDIETDVGGFLKKKNLWSNTVISLLEWSQCGDPAISGYVCYIYKKEKSPAED